MTSKLRAAVIGVGYLGRFHAQKYATLAAQEPHALELVGVADADPDTARRVATELGVAAFTDPAALPGQVDLVSIASSTASHYALARQFLAAGVHVLVEKPITVTVAEADALIALAAAKNLVLQVGHLERFNPVWLAARPRVTRPQFIEAHRMAPFKPRGTDVSVVLDLMIHDLDLILPLIASPLVDLRAAGVAVLTDGIDIANARLEFASGCVANLTASRTSTASLRRLRVFQHHDYLSLDFGERQVAHCHKKDGIDPAADAAAALDCASQTLPPADALLAEIEAFIAAIRQQTPPVVSGEDGRAALFVASEIERMIHARQHAFDAPPAAATGVPPAPTFLATKAMP
ncbi:MAG: UDP-N-acetyl-D-glucosamine dehydrogenase [Betaproteobacteria bacterium HGW-Betaproteobacteria-11]|nr:MAG: UDP-N-acetyl-D-glucosamine dehydrogenase [Betaproteobacteria bacterium HGW-Betaproteobacteria-11]